jgi:hypothetical protein
MTDPPTERLAAYEPIYRALLRILHALGRADGDLRSDAAVIAAVDLAADVAVSSGLLWVTDEGGDIVAALHNLADHLQKRRDSEPAKPLLGTVKEIFADRARPAMAN